MLAGAKEIVLDDMCPMAGPKHYLRHLRNISFVSSIHWNTTKLSLNKCRLAYLDIEIACRYPMLESFSIADNSMEYLSPRLILCLSTLRHLDISGNMLCLMNTRNSSHFKTLLRNLPVLQNVSLAGNRLTSLPATFFASNCALETIDLSINALEQVRVQLSHLKRLTTLNLSDNHIGRLDGTSMDTLFSIIRLRNIKIELRGNPLACKMCDDLESVQWLVNMKQFLSNNHDVTCLSENDQVLAIDGQTIITVQDTCERTKRIIIWTTVGCVTVCLSITLLALFKRRV